MRSPAGAFPNGNSSSTRNRSEASVPDAAEAPQRCPACSSTLVAPTTKAQTANSYNRCETCGEVWSPARRQAVMPRSWRA
jgi:hypothetical protein